jgi:HlyD family secretion protein
VFPSLIHYIPPLFWNAKGLPLPGPKRKGRGGADLLAEAAIKPFPPFLGIITLLKNGGLVVARKIIAVIVVLMVLVACSKGKRGKQMGSWVEVKKADLPAEVTATGTVVPSVGAQVKVGPRVSGKLDHLYVKVGDKVEKGQVLAVLEQKDLLANAVRMDAQVKDADATLAYAKASYNRITRLYGDGVVSIDDLDAAKKTLESAEAQLKSAKAQDDYTKIQLSYATVTAPISGTIGSVSTQEGETVAASLSAPTFVTILDLSRLEVDAYVDEVDIGRVKVGQKAGFTVDAFSDKTFNSHIEAIYPDATIIDNVVYYAVILGIEDKYEGLLRPQMTTSVSIHLDTLQGVLAIPSKAIKKDNGSPYVMVKDGNKTIKRQISVGREAGDLTEVKGGLSLGDSVLVQQQGNGEMPL